MKAGIIFVATGIDDRSNTVMNAVNISRTGWSTWDLNYFVFWCKLSLISLYLNEIAPKYQPA